MVVRTDIPGKVASALLVQALENREEFGFATLGWNHPPDCQGSLEIRTLWPSFAFRESSFYRAGPFLPSPGLLGPVWVLMANPQEHKSLPASPTPGPAGTSAEALHRGPL